MSLALAGCATTNELPTTQPVAESDQKLGEPGYWYDQPATATVSGDDFERLWSAADATARARLFQIDRQDRRGGVMVTAPNTSSQFFEPWRHDQPEGYETAQSSLATIRRTIRFEFTKQDDGSYIVTPKVLVERYSQSENRVTSVVLYRSAFRPPRLAEFAPYGTRETDRGINLPGRYWYAVGRDAALESAIVVDMQKRL